MSEVKKVFLNIFFFLGKRAIELFSLFLFYIVIARRFGVGEFGRFTFAGSFTMILGMFSDLGIQRFLNRESARDFKKAGSYLPLAVLVKTVLSAATFLLMFLLINLLGYPPETRILVYILGVSIILYSFQTFFGNILRGIGRVDIELSVTFWEKPLLLLFALMILSVSRSLVPIALLYCMIRAVILVVLVRVFIKNYGSIRIVSARISGPDVYFLLKKSIPYGIFFLFGIIYFHIDTIMLSSMKGNESVGIYQVAIKFALFLMIIPEAVTEIALPRMTAYFEASRENLRLFFSRVIKLLAFFAFAVTAVSMFSGRFIIDLSFGKSYIRAASLFPIIGWMLLFRFIAAGAGTALTACGLQKIRTYIVIICAFINISLNFLLIPVLDYTGAAYATLATNIFLLAAYALVLYRSTGMHIEPAVMLKSFFAFLVMSAVLYAGTYINMYLAIISSLLLYAVLFYLLRILNKDDLALLRNILIYKPGYRPGDTL